MDAFTQLFAMFEEVGVFQYILPFLVIFALVYGILTRTKIFKESPSINGLIAVSVALLSLRFESVPVFFSKVFPKLGVGLAVILVLLIVLGLFIPKEKWIIYILFSVSAVTLIAVLGSSFEAGYSMTSEFAPVIISGIVLIIIIAIIIGGLSKPSQKSFEDLAPPFLRDLFNLK